MDSEQKAYIEKHISLIEDNNWEKFFNKDAPIGLGEILYDAGIDFLSYMSSIPNFCFIDSTFVGITIPEQIRSIGAYAFSRCKNLQSIVIPDKVVKIEDGTFYQCINMTSFVLGSSVEFIDPTAFNECNSLKHITSSGNTKYHVRGDCIIDTTNRKLIVGCKGTTIPSDGSVLIIGHEAFSENKGLTSVYIPRSIIQIESSAFLDCTNLTTVEFEGTQEEWNKVTIKSNSFGYVPAKTIRCSDGVTRLRH